MRFLCYVWSKFIRADPKDFARLPVQDGFSAGEGVNRRHFMDTRVALIGIMVENPDSIEKMNQLLHEYPSLGFSTMILLE